MSYFNHAFQKVFIADSTLNSGNTTNLTPENNVFGIFDPKTYTAFDTAVSPTTPTNFMIATSSIYGEDKIGPFHGGYQESNKSKLINPRYISKFWKVEAEDSVNAITIIGKTDEALTDACECPTFSCGKTYRLRLDIKGSPALRFLNHQVYTTLDANTGCCADPATPTNVDPITVMVDWAKQILNHPYLSQFVSPAVRYTTDGSTWTTLDSLAELEGYTAQGTISVDTCVGLVLTGAYVDTKFGNCSFKPTDHFEKEPIQIYASFVDDINDVCQHESLCVTQVQLGLQGWGYGETIIRELILSESYSQNYFSCNPRIREITQGDAIFNVINRNDKYDVFYLQHSVPRFNNPTGTFDNDQYLLKIVAPTGATYLNNFVTWVEDNCTAAGNPVTLENF